MQPLLHGDTRSKVRVNPLALTWWVPSAEVIWCPCSSVSSAAATNCVVTTLTTILLQDGTSHDLGACWLERLRCRLEGVVQEARSGYACVPNLQTRSGIWPSPCLRSVCRSRSWSPAAPRIGNQPPPAGGFEPIAENVHQNRQGATPQPIGDGGNHGL